MNYINLIKRSFQLAWKYKFLWIFGLFIALVSGGGLNFYGFDSGTETNQNYNLNSEFGSFLGHNFGWILAVLIILFLILIALWILAIFSQGGLIACAEKLERGEKTNLKDGLKIAKEYFWRIFGLNLLIGLILFFSFLILGLPVGLLFYFQLWGRAILLLLLALVIFVPEAILLNLILTYALRGIVLGNKKIMESLRLGYNLVINNFWQTIVIALILIGISLAVTMALMLIVFLIGLPLFALFVIFKTLLGSIFFWILLVLAALILILGVLLIKTILTTFQYNTWTLVYIELNKKNQ